MYELNYVVTTLSGLEYASVTSVCHSSQTVCNYLPHRTWWAVMFSPASVPVCK